MNSPTPAPVHPAARVAHILMALCLGVMAVAVFFNVVLRYGFGSGIPASEELSRLLFVWMVFIGAAAAYPAGEHMAFTSLAGLLACSLRVCLVGGIGLGLLLRRLQSLLRL